MQARGARRQEEHVAFAQQVLGAHDIMTDMLGPSGLLTATAPDAGAMADVERGVRVLKIENKGKQNRRIIIAPAETAETA